MFWVELPEQRRLCPNFVKLRTPGHLWILLVLSWGEWLLVCNDILRGIWGVTVVDFGIELHPGTSPISMTPHRMAPVDLQELRV